MLKVCIHCYLGNRQELDIQCLSSLFQTQIPTISSHTCSPCNNASQSHTLIT